MRSRALRRHLSAPSLVAYPIFGILDDRVRGWVASVNPRWITCDLDFQAFSANPHDFVT